MLTTLYSKKSIIDERNREIYTEIAGKRHHSSQPSLCCKEVGGKWGIWAGLETTHILIPPVALLGTIFSDYERLELYYFMDEAPERKTPVYMDVIKEPFIYRWAMVSPDRAYYMEKYYMQDDYVSIVKQVISELFDKMLEDAPLAYKDSEVEFKKVLSCVEQLQVEASLPSFYTLRTDDIEKEEFVFEPHDSEGYTIGVGKRRFSSFLTIWNNSYERIRHQLEEFAHSRKATLELSFDGSETILKLEEVSIVDQTKEHDYGIDFMYQDYIRVEIRPDSYAGMPTIVGYCDVSKTLTTLYTGLLQMALMHPEEPTPYVSDTGRLVTYRMFKSPIIERTLDKDRRWDHCVCDVRQVHITDVLTIKPDHDVLLKHMDGTTEGCGKLDELCGESVHIEGLEEWCRELAAETVETADGEIAPKDWEDFHRRGQEYARQLRKVLPSEYDLWYEAPSEDKSGIIERPVLIM